MLANIYWIVLANKVKLAQSVALDSRGREFDSHRRPWSCIFRNLSLLSLRKFNTRKISLSFTFTIVIECKMASWTTLLLYHCITEQYYWNNVEPILMLVQQCCSRMWWLLFKHCSGNNLVTLQLEIFTCVGVYKMAMSQISIFLENLLFHKSFCVNITVHVSHISNRKIILRKCLLSAIIFSAMICNPTHHKL